MNYEKSDENFINVDGQARDSPSLLPAQHERTYNYDRFKSQTTGNDSTPGLSHDVATAAPRNPQDLRINDNSVQSEISSNSVPDLVQGSSTQHLSYNTPVVHKSSTDTDIRAKETLESWMITPTIHEALGDCGYNLRWKLDKLSPPAKRSQGRRGKKDVPRTIAQLNPIERQVLDKHLHRCAPGQVRDYSSIQAIEFGELCPPKEPNTQMPWRSITVFIERSASALAEQRRRGHVHQMELNCTIKVPAEASRECPTWRRRTHEFDTHPSVPQLTLARSKSQKSSRPGFERSLGSDHTARYRSRPASTCKADITYTSPSRRQTSSTDRLHWPLRESTAADQSCLHEVAQQKHRDFSMADDLYRDAASRRIIDELLTKYTINHSHV